MTPSGSGRPRGGAPPRGLIVGRLLLLVAAPAALASGCGGETEAPGWSAPALCALPFDAGPCNAAFPVFAHVDGACVTRTWGGCGGNENRFTTLEECMGTCLGLPTPNGCPAGRVAQRICLECGPAGGCGREAEVCAQPCAAPTDCGGALAACAGGFCQVAQCD